MEEKQPLYRPEVLAEQQTDWLGKVVLVTPPSARAFGLLALLIIIGFGSLLVFASFTNKVRVNGWLVVEQGQARIFAPLSGVVSELLVRDGDKVEAGDRLMIISAEQRSTSVGPTRSEITRLLTKRRSSLQDQITQQKRLLEEQLSGLRRRVAATEDEIEQLEQESAVQARRVRLSSKAGDRLNRLRRRGFVSLAQTQAQQEQSLEQQVKFQSLVREKAERVRDLVALQAELSELPLRTNVEIAALNRATDEIDQAIAQAEALRELVITAPQSGFVSGLQTANGNAVQSGLTLMSIVPDDAKLVAHLFGASRSVGFIQTGQRVNLSYDAFPYQKFGHQPGKISSVSRSALSPADLPPNLTGLSELISGTEPIYRIVVEPERRDVIAYGIAQPLQPGMRIAADILIERRRLYEWILDPLYTVTGRL